MAILAPAAVSTSIGPYALVMGVGFAIGVAGHIVRSRTLILAGILIVGITSAYFAFVVGKVT